MFSFHTCSSSPTNNYYLVNCGNSLPCSLCSQVCLDVLVDTIFQRRSWCTRWNAFGKEEFSSHTHLRYQSIFFSVGDEVQFPSDRSSLSRPTTCSTSLQRWNALRRLDSSWDYYAYCPVHIMWFLPKSTQTIWSAWGYGTDLWNTDQIDPGQTRLSIGTRWSRNSQCIPRSTSSAVWDGRKFQWKRKRNSAHAWSLRKQSFSGVVKR